MTITPFLLLMTGTIYVALGVIGIASGARTYRTWLVMLSTIGGVCGGIGFIMSAFYLLMGG